MFAIVDAVLLQPIVPNQDRLVRIWLDDEGVRSRISTRTPISYPEFEAWRRQNRTFEALSAINYADSMPTALTFDSRTSPIRLTPVSSSFFETLGVTTPVDGRLFSPDDDRR